MRTSSTISLGLFSMLCLAQAGAIAADYHLDTGLGSDANDGSRTHPWRSIAKANLVRLHPGDRLLFHGGQTFAGNLLIEANRAGTPDQPVIVGSYGDGRGAHRRRVGLKPDILVGGHSFVMDHPAAFIERYRKWSYEMRDAFQALSPDPDYRYWFDPFWVRAEPYRVVLRQGQSETVNLHVRNFRPGKQSHRIVIHTPPGLIAEPAIVAGELPGEARRSFPVRVKAAPEAEAGVRIVALDITLDDHRYGEWFDFVVDIAQSPLAPRSK